MELVYIYAPLLLAVLDEDLEDICETVPEPGTFIFISLTTISLRVAVLQLPLLALIQCSKRSWHCFVELAHSCCVNNKQNLYSGS